MSAIAACVLHAQAADGGVQAMTTRIDPVTRYIHIIYDVPPGAPDEVVAMCSWSPAGMNEWKPAKVMPLISETALNLLYVSDWQPWVTQGRITERRAAGLKRTVVFNPYPEAQSDGRVDVDFRVQVQSVTSDALAEAQTRILADNSDVVYIEEWSTVLQRDWVRTEGSSSAEPSSAQSLPTGSHWSWRTGQDASAGVTFGNALYGSSVSNLPLPQLTYPLNLQGWYAVFVCTHPTAGSIRLRFTGDERTDTLASRYRFEEVFWRWARMDRQHLVLKQPHHYEGWMPAHIDYVKLVPLTLELVVSLDAQFGGEPDKLVAGYWEPYSWAFYDSIQEPAQHREPLIAFKEARIGIVDTQLGRFGMKVVYESRLTDQLLYTTIGDPIGDVVQPRTDNVGRMQQYTNTLETELRYARELGIRLHANFGASNCYVGTPLEGDFAKAHPEWMRSHQLRFEVPEVRAYALNLYREALDIGAPGLSIDFCRYPETIDCIETCHTFLRELRKLADEYGQKRSNGAGPVRIPILVRFPGTGVRRCEMFDYRTWAREGWVDYLVPSNIQGRHHHFDVTPYIEAVTGTSCTLLPCVDGLSWGPEIPGPFLWRVAQLYDAGVPGIYVYQADGRILSSNPSGRRTMRMLSSNAAVRRFWEEDRRLRPSRSKGIFITPPHEFGVYHSWERLRVWVEGIEMGEMELHLDGRLVTHVQGPPYLLGTEENESDNVIPPGAHDLRIRVKDGDGWLEQTFKVQGAR